MALVTLASVGASVFENHQSVKQHFCICKNVREKFLLPETTLNYQIGYEDDNFFFGQG